MLSKVIGQEAAKKQILTAFANDRMAHAYLIAGDEGLGAEELALEATRFILCKHPDRERWEPCGECANCKKMATLQHPDVHYYFPVMRATEEDEQRRLLEKKTRNLYARVRIANGSIPIGDPENPEVNSIRGLSRAISLRSFEGELKIFILTFIEDMHAEATNAVLKILEEPPASTLYFLTTTNIHNLLPTIISRCQIVKLHRLTDDQLLDGIRHHHDVAENQAKFISRLANGNYYQASELISGDFPRKREAMLEFLLAAMSNKSASIQTIIEQWNEEAEKDKSFYTDILTMLITWFQDVVYMRELGEDKSLIDRFLINEDKTERLEKFIKAFPRVRVEEALSEIEKAVDLIGRNIYINLILMNLGLNLRSIVNPSSGKS